mmetsp:Transcript_19397/g.28011  ORF Transcript_19397/g.28011 Transcript_19397/m.28011 type:complete len:87 (+) Transcript_19397:2-262(+)
MQASEKAEENGVQRENAIKAAEEARKAALVTQSRQVMFEEELADPSLGLGNGSRKRKRSRARKGLSLTEYQNRKIGNQEGKATTAL